MIRCKALTAALLLTALGASAQDQPEYRMELGAGAGLATYQGDFSDNLVSGMQPLGGVMAKYKLNPRMAWTLAVGMGKLKGSSKNAGTWYPDAAQQPIDFSTSLTDVSLRYEYNFWAFGTGQEYRNAKPLTPFVTLGMGLAFAKPKDASSATGGQLLFGAGVKYKLAQRLNLAAEWVMHFTGTDRLDGIEDPYGIKSDGLFKNTDCYSVIALTLTYDLWVKCRTCHNDKD